jgi:hypothetical protein
MKNIDLLKTMSQYIEADVKWELKLLDAPMPEDNTYQKIRDELLQCGFSLETLIALVFSKENETKGSTHSPQLLQKFDRIVELYHHAPGFFLGSAKYALIWTNNRKNVLLEHI